MKDALKNEIPHLRAYARSLCGDVTAADDLVQDALVKAIANAEKFQEGTNLRAWLFTILRNTFISKCRIAGREVAMPENFEATLPAAPGNQEQSIEFDEFVRAMHSLPEMFREALFLVGAAGMDYESAAAVLGCEVGTAKSRVSRARRRLKEIMEGEAPLPTTEEAAPTFRQLADILKGYRSDGRPGRRAPRSAHADPRRRLPAFQPDLRAA